MDFFYNEGNKKVPTADGITKFVNLVSPLYIFIYIV